MTFDKFLKRNQLLASHLAQIAAYRGTQGWVDGSMPVDTVFRDVLMAQERLLTAAERLLEACAGSSSAGASVTSEAVDASLLPAAIEAGRSPVLQLMSVANMATAH